MSDETNPVIGQRVKRGQLIGYVGSTGNSTGPHIRVEVGDPANTGRLVALIRRAIRAGKLTFKP